MRTNKASLSLLLSVCGLVSTVSLAADFYWTGNGGDQIVTNRLNWADVNGVQVESAPTSEDTLIFDIVNGMIVTNFSNRADYEYRKVILRGTGNISFFGYGDCPTNRTQRIVDGKAADYDFYLPLEVVNETNSRRIYFNGQDPRVARGSSSKLATNIVNVVNVDGVIENGGHLQSNDKYHKVIKKGVGKYIPFGSNNYDIKNFTLEEGTIHFNWHSSRNWAGCSLVFLGDAPGKTFSFFKKVGKESYKFDNVLMSPEFWAQYVFQVPLVEENVTTTDHTLYSENGADLVYTNTVTDMSFTGRMRGSLNFHWAPTDVTKTFSYAKGESDTTGGLYINRGRMTMSEGAKFTALSALVVGGDAELELAEGTLIKAQTATVGGVELPAGLYSTFGEEGAGRLIGNGVLMVGGDFKLDVPYVDATKTATVIDCTQMTAPHSAFAQLAPIEVKLSEKMDVTNSLMHVTNRLAVAKFPASLELTADMFADTTTKTHALPTTWFETETVDDVTTLYLVAKPVISVNLYQGIGASASTKYYYTEDPQMWSDGKLPHSGADYYNWYRAVNGLSLYFYDGSSYINRVFGGDSLTVGYTLFYFNGASFDCDLRCYDCTDANNNVIAAQLAKRQVLKGKIYAEQSCNPLALKPSSSTTGAYGNMFVIESDISGPAMVRFKYTWSTSKLAELSVHGNNSGLTGRVEIFGNVVNESATKQYWQQLEVSVTNANALGGAMASKDVRGVRFICFPLLKINETTTYDTLNRNWFGENGVRLRVAEDKTFTMKNPYGCVITQSDNLNQFVPQRCAIEKTGAGTFAMGARVIPMNTKYEEAAPDGTNNLVRVLEGGIQAVAADAFDPCQLEFADGTSIVADPFNEDTAQYGLKLRDLSPIFAEGAKVRLSVAPSAPVEGPELTATFLTVPADTPDLTSVLVPEKVLINGQMWRGSLIKDSVEIDGEIYTRYSAMFTHRGLKIIFR